jgi:hypothetical protein
MKISLTEETCEYNQWRNQGGGWWWPRPPPKNKKLLGYPWYFINFKYMVYIFVCEH